MTQGVVSGLRVTQERASGPTVEAACRSDPNDRLRELLSTEPVSEAFVLQTCLRAELYVVTDCPAAGRRVLPAVNLDVPGDAVVTTDHEESLRHLIRVAAGLESFVTGEDPILGQFRDAVRTAEAADGIGPVLEPTVLKALHVGERARAETAINEGPTSIGGAAVTLLERERAIGESTVLVIGTGEMGTYAAEALEVRGVGTLLLANRTRRRAERLASMLNSPAEVVGLDALPEVLAAADLVVTATASPSPVVTREVLAAAGPTVVVDVARPPDVAPACADIEDVTVHELDALAALTESARERRREATEHVETMVEEATAALLEKHRRTRIDGVIAGMYRGAERTKRRELDTVLSKLEHHGGLTDDQREDVRAFADAIVSKLLAPPTEALRDAAATDDWATVEAAIELMDPEMDGETGIPAPLEDMTSQDASGGEEGSPEVSPNDSDSAEPPSTEGGPPEAARAADPDESD